MSRVVSLHYYPVKSCRGVDVMEIEIGPRGPLWDREWMIVDEAGVFVTQREKPQMARIRPKLTANNLILSVPDEDGGDWDWEVPLSFPANDEKLVEVWGTRCKAFDEGDSISDVLSVYLGKKVRLVRMQPGLQRGVSEKLNHPDAQIAFADQAPTLLTTLPSLADVNRRLPPDKIAPINRFRSNIVVTGTEAFAEDKWSKIKVGAIDFDVVKSCSRCTIVNTDQETGLRGHEPLKTMATYRREGNKVLFGRYLVHGNQGKIKVGDPLTVVH